MTVGQLNTALAVLTPGFCTPGTAENIRYAMAA
jgi:hypothetical protein